MKENAKMIWNTEAQRRRVFLFYGFIMAKVPAQSLV